MDNYCFWYNNNLNTFNAISKFFLLLFAFVSSIKPQTIERNAANIIMTLTISVGKRGTKPVFKNSANTGKNRRSEPTNKNNESVPKNFKGL